MKKETKKKILRLLLATVVTILSYILYDFGLELPSALSPKTESESRVSKKSGSDQSTLTGEVIKVADGDTFTLKTTDGEQVNIRLYGIDAPEKGQDFGTKSHQHLNALCYGKYVIVKTENKDKYGRTLGTAYIDGLNINEDMVRQGLAWYYSDYANDPRLESLEQAARKQKLNIWSKRNPQSPHDFRKAKKEKK